MYVIVKPIPGFVKRFLLFFVFPPFGGIHGIMALVDGGGIMAKAVLACETIRDELERTLADAGGDFRVRWIESALHNFPDLLRERLVNPQEM
jgi:hypothetical protein